MEIISEHDLNEPLILIARKHLGKHLNTYLTQNDGNRGVQMLKVIFKYRLKDNINEEEYQKFVMDSLEHMRGCEGYIGMESFRTYTGESWSVSLLSYKGLSEWAKYVEMRKTQKLIEKYSKFYQVWNIELWNESPGL